MAYRNSYLTKKALNNCLFASILTMCASQLNVTVDGIIVSHLVSPNALSATNLFTPISLAIVSLGSLFGIGATIYAARLMGQRKTEEANRSISTALLSVIVVGLCFGLLSFTFRDAITDFICQEKSLVEFFKPYMTWMSSFAVIVMINSLVSQMVEIDGRPDLVTKSVCVNVVANVIMDFVFVYFFHWGIAGSAIASLLASCINIAILVRYILSSSSSYQLSIFKGSSWGVLSTNMQYGTSLIIGNMVLMIMFLLMNNITQEKQGVNGIFALSVCMNLLSIGIMFTSGISSALLAIGSFMFGQKDMKGVNYLVNRSIFMLEAAMLTIFVVISICPSLISNLFGANSPELQMYTNDSLVKFVWILPFVMLILMLANVYQMIGRLVLAPSIVFTFPVVLIPSMIYVPEILGAENFWYSFPITSVTLIVLVIVVSSIVYLKEKGVHFITLIPKAHANIIYDESVSADSKGVASSVKSLSEALQSPVVPTALRDRIKHCTEEIELNIAVNAKGKKTQQYFDVLLSVEEDKIHASIKDNGRPFNPVLVDEGERKAGLNIAFGFSDDLDYKYMFGQNMTFITWNKK